MKKQTPTFSVSKEIGMQAVRNDIPELAKKIKELDIFIINAGIFILSIIAFLLILVACIGIDNITKQIGL